MQSFNPSGTTVNINVGAASASIMINNDAGETQVRVYNDGSATAWIAFGSSSSVAATVANSIPIPAGAIEVYTLDPSNGWVAAIAAGATGKIYFTPGIGI